MSYRTVVLQSSGPVTASGSGAWIPVQAGTMVAIALEVTAGSGSPTFDAWCQGSYSDADATGFDVPADIVQKDAAGAAAENAATTNKRDIVDNKTTTTAERWIAIYKHFPLPFIRARHSLSGAAASITYSSTGMVK